MTEPFATAAGREWAEAGTEIVDDTSRGRYRLYLWNRPSTPQVGSITHGGPAQYRCPRCLGDRCEWCLNRGWVAGGHR